MTWKKISDESLGAKPIYSVEDSQKLIGYEGWRVLRYTLDTFNGKGHLLSDHVFKTGNYWTSSRMRSFCYAHANCQIPGDEDPDYCFNKFTTGINSCHSSNTLTSRCPCGIYSFASREKLRDSAYWDSMSTSYIPVRLVNAGKMFKGRIGQRAQQATLTGIWIPPRGSNFYQNPSHRLMTISRVEEISKRYNIPFLDRMSPTSEQVLHQNFGE